jgi:PhzF family phenazine biosynthesis protein
VRIRIIDAFADRPFVGNPAAVCLLDTDSWPDQYWMQQVAAEMNLAETAFAHPLPESADAHWALRWFTPAVEVDLCGHATLATAHALHSDRKAPNTVRFSSRSGILIAHTHPDSTITLDFPAAPVTEIPTPSGLPEALSAKPDAVYGTGALGDLLAVFADETGVRTLAPISPRWPSLPAATASAESSPPPRRRIQPAATTSSRAFSPPPSVSPRIRSPAVRTPPWAPTGQAAWAGTTSPAYRHPPAPAWFAPPSAVTGSTSQGARSRSSTAPCTTSSEPYAGRRWSSLAHGVADLGVA